MTRARVAGPMAHLDAVLRVVQDAGVLHVVHPAIPGDVGGLARTRRERRHLERLLADVETALSQLGLTPSKELRGEVPARPPQAARRARRVRRQAERLTRARASLEDERVLLERYREFFQAFESLAGHELTWPDGQAFYVVLRAGAASALAELRRSLEEAVSGEVELLHRALSSGEEAVLILVSPTAAPKVSRLLSESRVEELPAPSSLGQTNLLRALPALKARLAAIPPALEEVARARQTLAAAEGPWLEGLNAWLHDQLLVLAARAQVHTGSHLFVLEGWLPRPRLAVLSKRLFDAFGEEVVVEAVGEEAWSAQDAPVALSNPPLIKPFEVLTRLVPLPRYGTVDPTPFLAFFFPAFFGVILGDVGYGLLLAGLAVLLRWRSKPQTTLRSISAVAGACALFTVLFGFVFGEFFGTLGHALGLTPLVDREKSVVPFLLMSVAVGGAHITLGLVLAVVAAWRRGQRREAAGRTVAIAVVALTALALLAAFEVVPRGLFLPFVIAVAVAIPVLLLLEGLVALIELLSTFGHILSYARIMALGTASLMLAVVANQMAGALGSVLVGVFFALLLHLINFVLGLFSPTIHALRLHYVEFFGKFFSPGGTEYRPLDHWHPST